MYEKPHSVMLLHLTAQRTKMCELLSTPRSQVTVIWTDQREDSGLVTIILELKFK